MPQAAKKCYAPFAIFQLCICMIGEKIYQPKFISQRNILKTRYLLYHLRICDNWIKLKSNFVYSFCFPAIV